METTKAILKLNSPISNISKRQLWSRTLKKMLGLVNFHKADETCGHLGADKQGQMSFALPSRYGWGGSECGRQWCWREEVVTRARMNIGYWWQLFAQHSGEGRFPLCNVLSKDNSDSINAAKKTGETGRIDRYEGCHDLSWYPLNSCCNSAAVITVFRWNPKKQL